MKLYAYTQLAMLAALGAAAFFFWRYFVQTSPLDIGRDLKEKTPLGIPSRAIDSGITAATGRDETLGGWLAEMFDPSTREVKRVLSTPSVLPHSKIPAPAPTPYVPPWDFSA